MTNNYNRQALSRYNFTRLPMPFGKGEMQLVDCVSVARVRPRTSKGITDLLLPHTSISCLPDSPSKKIYAMSPFRKLISRLRSRSLTELTRQIAPPTKNGHAPLSIESRKIFNLSILTMSGLVSFPVLIKLSRRLHSWWCPSVNTFKFQPCDHTPPRTQRL